MHQSPLNTLPHTPGTPPPPSSPLLTMQRSPRLPGARRCRGASTQLARERNFLLVCLPALQPPCASVSPSVT